MAYMKDARNEGEYDLYSAITFLLVGLGIGSLLAIVYKPKPRLAPEEISNWRMSRLEPRREAEERAG
jgi:hypothetical protein